MLSKSLPTFAEPKLLLCGLGPHWPCEDILVHSGLGIDKSSSHHLSQTEIASDNPGYPTLIQLGRTPWVIQPVFIDLPRYAS